MTENGSPLPLLSRYAIMVDVGYIYASAGELLFGAASAYARAFASIACAAFPPR
jgi:hypothetical protein